MTAFSDFVKSCKRANSVDWYVFQGLSSSARLMWRRFFEDRTDTDYFLQGKSHTWSIEPALSSNWSRTLSSLLLTICLLKCFAVSAKVIVFGDMCVWGSAEMTASVSQSPVPKVLQQVKNILDDSRVDLIAHAGNLACEYGYLSQ